MPDRNPSFPPESPAQRNRRFLQEYEERSSAYFLAPQYQEVAIDRAVPGSSIEIPPNSLRRITVPRPLGQLVTEFDFSTSMARDYANMLDEHMLRIFGVKSKASKEKEAKKKKEERMEAERLAKLGIQRFVLYNGEVIMDFKQNSTKYRYVVTDRRMGISDKPTRGVTTTLKDVLDKPGLRTWPMNMSHQFLFGNTWVTLNEEDGSGEYQYDPKKAALKPETPYTAEQLQEFVREAEKQHTKRSDRGKDIGHLVHSACELFLCGNTKNPVDAAIGAEELTKEDRKAVEVSFRAFEKWWKSLPKNTRLIDVEKPIYSRRLGYAGTFDLAVEIDGRPMLLDIKTTNRSKDAPMGIYPEYFLQLGAYSYAYREETGIQFADLGIVNVGKDGRLSLATASDMRLSVDECERAYAFAVRLHDWVEKVKPLTKEQGFRSCLFYPDKAKVEGQVSEK